MAMENAVENATLEYKKVTVDGGVVENHNLTELIKAEKHIKGKSAMQGKGLGIKFIKLVPSGTI